MTQEEERSLGDRQSWLWILALLTLAACAALIYFFRADILSLTPILIAGFIAGWICLLPQDIQNRFLFSERLAQPWIKFALLLALLQVGLISAFLFAEKVHLFAFSAAAVASLVVLTLLGIYQVNPRNMVERINYRSVAVLAELGLAILLFLYLRLPDNPHFPTATTLGILAGLI